MSRTGAIPKRLASRGREERNPRQSPASPDGNRGGEGGARSEEERLSQAAERDLRDYLYTEPTEPPLEEPPRESPPHRPSAPRRLARQGPEGRERKPEFQEHALPPQFVLSMLPVPTKPTAREPMEWDMESGTLTGTAAGTASIDAPPPSGPRPSGERRQKRKKRPHNSRRHLEEDDYVSGLPRPPRSPSPPGPPSRPPPSQSVERGAGLGRARVREGREEGPSR